MERTRQGPELCISRATRGIDFSKFYFQVLREHKDHGKFWCDRSFGTLFVTAFVSDVDMSVVRVMVFFYIIQCNVAEALAP